jgi:hypothetical protein
MKIYYLLFLSFFIITLVPSCDELGSKSEYAVLQQAEFEYRQNKLNGILIISKDKYFLAGFPSRIGDVNVWVLLNSKHYPYYKQIPEFDFLITADDMEKIKRVNDVSKKVIAELELRIKSK